MAMSRSLAGTWLIDPAVDRDGARGDRLQPGDHAQRRGLAAARRAEQHHELAVGDREARRPSTAARPPPS